ncbi:hypothetical protein OVY29_04280 [Sphingopyxis sp. SE2]|uniref:tetratricopeptide repeat protein n=1 Tax=unclassified Sphingopyxis TaxID=2614943 RepID=UPI00051013E9|nr:MULTISPECIES: hypothetical protein [unclassified Sphingopyxis]KGB53677.1 hypothetical protein FG95_03087 [Sphingopyxis sp. LC363]MDT7527878.1 hypothetical protein [Sphingopyxis sp. SE2]
MRSAERRRSTRDEMAKSLTPSVIIALFAGLLTAILAFSQAAASTGIVIDTFRPLGGGFFSWRSGQNQLTQRLYDNRGKVDAKVLFATGRTGLRYAPLSARSLWMVGKGYEAKADLPRARQAMLRAEGITRREASVQLWLAEDALRREKIEGGLRHYDLIIRSRPDSAQEILPRLAAIMVAPEGRKYLQPYVRQSNPWFPELLAVAVNRLPQSEPVGRLLVERKAKAPDLRQLDAIYAQLVSKLVSQGADDVALQLYPLLPRGNNAVLAEVSGIVNGKTVEGYPPFIWQLGNEAYGATLVSVGAGGAGMEFYGASGTVGVTATKLFAPNASTQFRWRVRERTPNLQSSATWVATCLSGQDEGAKAVSVNLLDVRTPTNRDMVMSLPEGCDLFRLDMRIVGGIGTNPASLIVSGLSLGKAGAAN